MSTASLHRETFLPGVHLEQLAQILDLLRAPAANDEAPAPRYFLSGADPNDQVEIPAEVHQVLGPDSLIWPRGDGLIRPHQCIGMLLV